MNKFMNGEKWHVSQRVTKPKERFVVYEKRKIQWMTIWGLAELKLELSCRNRNWFSILAYWLLSCNWKTFGEHFIDLNRAEELRKVHDLEVRLHETSMMHHRRTGFGKTHTHSVFENGAGGRRRSSSVNEGSIAGLGGDLLATFIRSKKREKSKRTTQALRGGGAKPKRQPLTASQIRPEQRSGPDATETGNDFGMIQTGRYAPRNSVFKSANYTSKIEEKQHDRGKLSANIVLKASPNESYYIQVANNAHMRSWKMGQWKSCENTDDFHILSNA